MAGFVGKAVDFVFDTWAVARPHPFNFSGEHRTAVKTTANDVMGFFVGMSDPASHLRRMHVTCTHETEHRHVR